MKKTGLLIVLLSTAFAGKGQNLVPNGDFETHTGCPSAYGQLNWVAPWITASGGTPDYFHQCATATWVDVPNNGLGYQQAHSGSAYTGIFTASDEAGYKNYREYLETAFSQPLTAGGCYHFEMYVNIGNNCTITTDDIGIYFSNTLVNAASYNFLPLAPQIINTNSITDTAGWTLISANYTATGNENYMIIGNFKDSVNTTVYPSNTSGTIIKAYIYIDDILLTPCTSIEEQSNNDAITIYPNPVKDEFKVSGLKFKVGDQIKIYDVMGKEIYRDEIKTSNFKLQTSNYPPGIYFIEINTAKETYRKKFIKE